MPLTGDCQVLGQVADLRPLENFRLLGKQDMPAVQGSFEAGGQVPLPDDFLALEVDQFVNDPLDVA